MAMTPNKVVIPKEYTSQLHAGSFTTAFTSSNTVTIDNTAIDYSTINVSRATYDMVGEFEYSFPSANISVANSLSTTIRQLKCQINVNNTLDRYRYIRFILEPNVLYRNTGSVKIPQLNFYFTLVYNGSRYSISKNLTSTSGIPAYGSFVTSKYSFLFDTVKKTLTDITSAWGTDSWVE